MSILNTLSITNIVIKTTYNIPITDEHSIRISTGKFRHSRKLVPREKYVSPFHNAEYILFFLRLENTHTHMRIRLFLHWSFPFVPVFSSLHFLVGKRAGSRKRKFPRDSARAFSSFCSSWKTFDLHFCVKLHMRVRKQ